MRRTYKRYGQKKKSKLSGSNSVEQWAEEQNEQYLQELYGMEFITGFTDNGVPYGIFKEEDESDIADNDKFGILIKGKC